MRTEFMRYLKRISKATLVEAEKLRSEIEKLPDSTMRRDLLHSLYLKLGPKDG